MLNEHKGKNKIILTRHYYIMQFLNGKIKVVCNIRLKSFLSHHFLDSKQLCL